MKPSNSDTHTSVLEQCQTSDRFRIEKRLQQIAARSASGQPTSKMQADLEQIIEKSTALTQQRLDSIGVVNYPDLPVAEKKDAIKAAISENQVVVIAGETGSGKTTQLPKICLELGLGAKGLIGHTQPRRLAARTVANRIADELNTTIGDKVGYQVRFTDQVSQGSLIKLMTDGILLAETQHDRYLSKYEVIIIDEAHERSLNIDFLLGYIKRILPQRPDLKLIITSATIDLERFSKHFDDAPVIEVSGRTFPVDVLYRPLVSDDEDTKDRTTQQAIIDAVEEIIALDRQTKNTGPKDVLVFLSGERDIREAADVLRKAQLRDTEIMPLYARLSAAEQNRIFENKRSSGRRIVLATNVAETSVTVPGIGYVIDTGVARISRYSYRSKVQRLPIEAISQASANQRAGRCGRIAPGVCIRLYSEDDFLQRPLFTDAEIRRTNLAAVILQMLSLKLGSIDQFPFIDPPDSRFINDGFKLLEELGAVDAHRKMTSLGRRLSMLPVDPRIGRMIIEADKQQALSELLIIASALSVQDPRERPADKQQAADQKHQEYIDKDSDFLGFVNLWNSYEEQRQSLSQNQLRNYCKKHFLSYMRMREWRDVHRQLHLSIRQMNMRENSEPASYKAIHVSLLAGLLSQLGFKQENKEYLGARNRRFHIFPASGLFKKSPKWIMAAELVETSKVFARCVAKIEPEWAEPLASHLVKRTYLEPAWHKKRAQVVAVEQVTLFGLLIIPKRIINYGKIDPQASHDIFIRSALVEGDYQTKAPFFTHNQALLEQVEALEAKSRRKDLLVDEDTLFDFYFRKLNELGGENVVNGAGFEKWRKDVEQANSQVLFLTQADILQRSADHISKQAYPDDLKWKGVKLSLHYHFEPSAQDDGVTLDVPLPLLKQLPLQRLEWLVPGMLREKCEAILRSLPKQTRKQFVPVPDYAQAVSQAMVFADGDLYEAMSHQLLRMTGHRVTSEELKQATLEDHYRINLRLLDAKGKQIAQGRDWEALCEQFGESAEQAINSAPDEKWGRTQITRWDFGELPVKIQTRQAGGIQVDAWPMLVDQGTHVDLKVAMNASFAEQSSILGVVRLARLALNSEIKKQLSSIFKINESAIYVAKVMTKKQLEEGMLTLALRKIMDLDEKIPRTEKDFENRLLSVKKDLPQVLRDTAEQVFAIHQSYHRIQSHLNGRVSLDGISILNDIKSQLGGLINKQYLFNMSWVVFAEYTRYMNAIEVRLEKYQREIPKQRLLSDQLQGYYQACYKAFEVKEKRGEFDLQLSEFRWYLEEYRVSLFAQQLGTKEPVSEKRVVQRWRALEAD